jgi:hypothetical protein
MLGQLLRRQAQSRNTRSRTIDSARVRTERVIPEYPKIAEQVTRAGVAALPAPGIEGTDLFLSLESVVAHGIERIRQ